MAASCSNRSPSDEPHSTPFKSPEVFRGYPKAESFSNNIRKKKKSMIATSTPEMKRLQQVKRFKNKKLSSPSKLRAKKLFQNDDIDPDVDFLMSNDNLDNLNSLN